MSEKTLKFGEIKVSKKEFHVSQKPVVLNLVDVDEIVISDKIVIKVLNILLAIKMMILLDIYPLFYLK